MSIILFLFIKLLKIKKMDESFRFSYYPFILSSHICTLGQACLFIPTPKENKKKGLSYYKEEIKCHTHCFMFIVLVLILFHCKYVYYPGFVLFGKALLHIKAKDKAKYLLFEVKRKIGTYLYYESV